MRHVLLEKLSALTQMSCDISGDGYWMYYIYARSKGVVDYASAKATSCSAELWNTCPLASTFVLFLWVFLLCSSSNSPWWYGLHFCHKHCRMGCCGLFHFRDHHDHREIVSFASMNMWPALVWCLLLWLMSPCWFWTCSRLLMVQKGHTARFDNQYVDHVAMVLLPCCFCNLLQDLAHSFIVSNHLLTEWKEFLANCEVHCPMVIPSIDTMIMVPEFSSCSLGAWA